MPAHARIENLVVLDELEMRMRRTAARLSMLASDVAASASQPDGAARAAAHLAAASALSRHVPELRHAADELAAAVAGLNPTPGISAETVALLALAELERSAAGDTGAIERATTWARRLSSPEGAEGAPEPGQLGARAALALARTGATTGEARLKESAEREAAHLSQGDGADAVVAARALAALGNESALSRATAACDRAVLGGSSGCVPAETNPVRASDCVALCSELWVSEGDARHLDCVERMVLNDLLFCQTEGGGAASGRTPDGEPGTVDDSLATPALALGLAAAGRHVLASDTDGRIVAGLAANASATVRVDDSTELRCLVSTQLPVRGWTKWTFEPLKPTAAPLATASTRRPARRKRITQSTIEPERPPESPAEAGPATFALLVRIPKWGLDSGRPPVVKVDKQKANVKMSKGFLCFDVPTDRTTEIEVVLPMAAGVIERQSPVSWANEAALTYGPLVLTASARLNPGENLSMPMKIVSSVEELAPVTDIRRRLPVVEAKALSGGGRVMPMLFSPLSETGGFTDGVGGSRPVRAATFRTWHRLGR